MGLENQNEIGLWQNITEEVQNFCVQGIQQNVKIMMMIFKPQPDNIQHMKIISFYPIHDFLKTHKWCLNQKRMVDILLGKKECVLLSMYTFSESESSGTHFMNGIVDWKCFEQNKNTWRQCSTLVVYADTTSVITCVCNYSLTQNIHTLLVKAFIINIVIKLNNRGNRNDYNLTHW